jgi:hypothetical protein
MAMPFSKGSSFLIFRIFVAFFLTIFGLAIAFHASELIGSLIAAVGLTFLTIMWLIVRSSTLQ